MKIALVITGLGMGGAERQVCDLADQYIAKGHQVMLMYLTGEVICRPHSELVTLVALNMAKTPLGLIRAYCRGRNILKNFNPDVIHSHMVHANIFSRIIRLSLFVPKLICTAHSSNEGGRMRMFAYRITDNLCDLNTNVSEEAVEIFVKKKAMSQARVKAVHNGIDIERFKFDLDSRVKCRGEINVDHNASLLLAVGRLTEAKDHLNLLAAISKIAYVDRPLQLVIIGTGEEYASLSNRVVELGLVSKVHLLGIKHNIHEWMSAADVFVLSSAWEGFGLVVAEAMACQRIVVATDCGGVKEVVGNCGILVPPRDHLALADGINKALQMSSDEIEMIGAAARDRIVTRYSLSAQAESWLSLYQ